MAQACWLTHVRSLRGAIQGCLCCDIAVFHTSRRRRDWPGVDGGSRWSGRLACTRSDARIALPFSLCLHRWQGPRRSSSIAILVNGVTWVRCPVLLMSMAMFSSSSLLERNLPLLSFPVQNSGDESRPVLIIRIELDAGSQVHLNQLAF